MARAPLRHHLFKGKEEPEFGFVHKPLRPPADPLDQIRTMGFERGNLPSGGRKVGLKFRDLAPALPCKIRDQHRDTQHKTTAPDDDDLRYFRKKIQHHCPPSKPLAESKIPDQVIGRACGGQFLGVGALSGVIKPLKNRYQKNYLFTFSML
jgi:hypothetical protein